MGREPDERSMVFSCLIKKVDNMWIGHCLELDIVATSDSMAELKSDLQDLIIAQVSYAFSNDNVDNLYRSAPASVWKEYYACKVLSKDKFSLTSNLPPDDPLRAFVPPWIIQNTCLQGEEVRA